MNANARVYVEIKGKFAHLFFDQPAARNAMTQEMYEQLRSICLELNQNSQIRAVILRGIGGKSFVSGSDIAQFTAFKDGEDGVRYEKLIDHYLGPLQQLSMPSIAVIDGLAVGGGLAIASLCDFRIATPTAKFGVPIARTLGNTLSPSNIAWLVAHLGVAIIKRMLLLAELIPASELHTQGFVYKIGEQEQLEQMALDLAEQLSALAPVTQKASKQIMARVIHHSLPDCSDLIREVYGSSDFKDGVRSFLAGEPAQWKGK
jgi:enoyl-CoA hydratase/carnithine racemase